MDNINKRERRGRRNEREHYREKRKEGWREGKKMNKEGWRKGWEREREDSSYCDCTPLLSLLMKAKRTETIRL